MRAWVLAVAASGLLAGVSAADADVRAVDSFGRVLTVGNWSFTPLEGGRLVRWPDARALGFELRDGATLIAEGNVPGTADAYRDFTPALSRNPVTGEMLLAWSRETPIATREIVVMRFNGTAWAATSEQVVVAGTGEAHADPGLIHDATGSAYIAWRRLDLDASIRIVGLAADGTTTGEQSLSTGMAVRNGAPRLGVDPAGNVIVAFLGLEAASGQFRVFVLGANSSGGGLIHVPTPVIELGVRATLPVPNSMDPLTLLPSSNLNLTVLGGTTLAWWADVDTSGANVIRYVYEHPELGWSGAPAGTLALCGSCADPTREALDLLEAYLRRVITIIGPTHPVPVSPGRIGTRTR